MKSVLAFVLVALFTAVLTAAGDTDTLLARAWPAAPDARLSEVGTGVAVVFSPDLSVKGNCHFYTALGFACFDDSDWTRVLDGVHDYNARFPSRAIRTLVLETHGTNGNGLKLQRSDDPAAERSYISVGALQERVEREGVRSIILSACNSGRLLRPSIYANLDPAPGDKLFLPATCGIIGASPHWSAGQSKVTIITPAQSHIEMTVVGSVKELAPSTRKMIDRSAAAAGVPRPRTFAVSDLMMQMLTRRLDLQLRVGTEVEDLSRQKTTEDQSEKLFKALLRHLNSLARPAKAGVNR
jgi:hypothetical protein